MNQKISVLIPAYNVAPWIGSTLDSILSQTYKNLEVIVVDDGSTDNTGSVLDGYAARDERVIVVHQPNAGLVAARETGIANATGEYVTFVDGDDTIEADMYERLMANALKYDADISHCGMVFDFPDGHSEPHYGTGAVLVHDNAEGLKALLDGDRIEPSLCCKLYRRTLIADSCLDPTIQHNEDLLRNFILFHRAKQSVFEDFCGYHYYQRPGSICNSADKLLVNMEDTVRARKLILENSTADIRPHAMRLWLSTYVDFLNQHYGNSDSKVRSFYAHCKNVLKQERRNIPFLIRRQQLAAYLLMYAPWLHHIVYHIYRSRR